MTADIRARVLAAHSLERLMPRLVNVLKSGGSDHPMSLLKRAGVDLSQPETVRAVSSQLDGLVDRLERELA